MNWKSWSDHLLRQFKRSRKYPGWNELRELYEIEDQKVFDVYEKHYQAGRIQCEEPRRIG